MRIELKAKARSIPNLLLLGRHHCIEKHVFILSKSTNVCFILVSEIVSIKHVDNIYIYEKISCLIAFKKAIKLFQLNRLIY